jgi:SH3-like domain-containing protein
MLCLLLISVSVSAFKAYRIKGNRQAVLLEESAELRENPEDSAKRVATIHEGVILDIRKTAGYWLFVNLPNGDGGWINGELVGECGNKIPKLKPFIPIQIAVPKPS